MAWSSTSTARKLERSPSTWNGRTRRQRRAGGTSRRSSSASQRASVSVDAAGRVTTVNSAARASSAWGRRAGVAGSKVFERPDLQPLGALLERARTTGADCRPRKSRSSARSATCHLAAVATALHREGGAPEGAVLVFDDITPLMRAQKVAAWREVARRLAHEIKNPLTPIQLSAERLRRHFSPPPPSRLRRWWTSARRHRQRGGVAQALVDEFSQFARMPRPARVPTDSTPSRLDAAPLQRALPGRPPRVRPRPGAPALHADPEQIRTGAHQPGRQRHRGHGSPRGGHGRPNRAGLDERVAKDHHRVLTGRGFRRRSARSCSCRTTRRSSGQRPRPCIVRRIVASTAGASTWRHEPARDPGHDRAAILVKHHPDRGSTSRACAALSGGVLRDEGYEVGPSRAARPAGARHARQFRRHHPDVCAARDETACRRAGGARAADRTRRW